MGKVVWRPEARVALLDIIDYVAARDAVAADRLLSLLEQAVGSLAQHAYLGRVGRVPGTRELVAHPNYLVVYEVAGAEVTVLAVVHARRKFP